MAPSDGERRALNAAVLASILLHLLLLNALPGWRDAQRPLSPTPILARVVPERAAEPPQTGETALRSSPAPVTRVPPKRSEPRREETVARAQVAPAIAAAENGTVAQYRLAIISLARGFNRYPRIAIENNWQGRSEVRVTVGSDGAIAALAVRSGSGYEILDRQALDMIGRAASQVPLPVALRGRQFAIDIPVIFRLNDAPH